MTQINPAIKYFNKTDIASGGGGVGIGTCLIMLIPLRYYLYNVSGRYSTPAHVSCIIPIKGGGEVEPPLAVKIRKGEVCLGPCC